MSGFEFAYRMGGAGGGQGPLKNAWSIGKNLSGAPTSTNLAGGCYAGDVVVFTTKSTVTTAANKVVRTVVADDKTAHYAEGGIRAGLLGISESNIRTDANGKVSAVASTGGYFPKVPSAPSLNPFDTNGHSQTTFTEFDAESVFKTKLAVASSSAAVYLALPGTLAGLTIPTTDNGIFKVNLTDTGADLCFRIIDVDPNDTTFTNVFVAIIMLGTTTIVGSYAQATTSVAYSTQ